MSFFEGARNITAIGSNFTGIGRDQINVDLVDQLTYNVTNTYHQHISLTATGSSATDLNALTPEARSKTNYKPNPSTCFQGRKDELDQLKAYFKPRFAEELLSRRSLLLYGMGGIGKTQICLKFAEEMTDHYVHIFWVDASTPDTIALGLKTIANTVIGAQLDSLGGSPESILQWMSLLRDQWLLVLDNAEEHILKFIPPGNSGDILITSRNRAVRRHTTSSIEVERMSEEDAISLLMRASHCDDPSSAVLQSAARAIVQELYYLPLAVDQAGAFIDTGCSAMEDYLELYSRYKHKLLDDHVFRTATSYEQTVYGTWEVSYQKIKERANSVNPNAQAYRTAILILETFAFFYHDHIDEDIFKRASQSLEFPDKGITQKQKRKLNPTTVSLADHVLLSKDKDGIWDKLQFRNGIQILVSFSLLKQHFYGSIYSMHPLVHSWSQDRMPQADYQQKCRKATALLARSIPSVHNYTMIDDYLFYLTFIPHIASATKYSGLQEDTNDNEDTLFASVYYDCGHYKQSEQLYIKTLKRRKKVLGKKHPSSLASMSNLASTYSEQGKWQEAEKLELQTLDLSREVLGEEHPDTLISMSNLALSYWKQGKWREAEKLQLQVLDLKRKLLGEEHPSTLTSINNLAATYSSQGKWQETEKLELQNLALCRKVLGEEHPDTLVSMSNLAQTYSHQGKQKEAEKLGLQVLDLKRKLLGEEHPSTLTSMSNLALIYRDQERWEEAEKLMVQTLDMMAQMLGINHLDTLSIENILSEIYEHNGKLEAATALQEHLEMTQGPMNMPE